MEASLTCMQLDIISVITVIQPFITKDFPLKYFVNCDNLVVSWTEFVVYILIVVDAKYIYDLRVFRL
jgi:hypothetical protein